jgi:hypothetical protein
MGGMMNTVVDCVGPSRIELAAKTTQKDYIFYKTIGILCVPFCCTGCMCLVMSSELGKMADQYRCLVEFYGGVASARQMAQGVRNQSKLFDEAVVRVNNCQDTKDIDARLTLLDLVRFMNPKFRKCCRSPNFLVESLQDIQKEPYKDYYSAVWKAFLDIGGNPHAVIFGFIELIVENTDPSSTIAISYVNQILTNNSLKNEIRQASNFAV